MRDGAFGVSRARTLGLLLGGLLVVALPACSDDDSGNSGSCSGLENACETAGQTRCNEDTVQTCRDNGQGCLVWTDTETCGEHAACAGGMCQCADRCIPGEHQCVGDVLQGCIQDAEGCAFWSDEQDCSQEGGTCDDSNGAQCVGGQPACGNGIVEEGETCDGSELGGESCESQGFDGGTLACNDTCDGYDTSRCVTNCGNGVLDQGETCDGSELGGESCESQGFDGGTLACNDTCDGYVTSSCFTIPPGGDCTHAQDVTNETFPYQLTGAFTDDPTSGFSCASAPTNVVWFEYQAPADGQYTIGVTNGTASSAGSGLAVFAGTACGPYDT